MVNTISLSSDLNTLYLVDDGRVIPFDLRKPEGVLIGKIHNQIAAATGVKEEDGKPKHAKGDRIELEVKSNDQYTFTYNRASAGLGLIGATDIIQTTPVPGEPPVPTGTCELQLFSLDDYDLHIQRNDKALVITKLSKK